MKRFVTMLILFAAGMPCRAATNALFQDAAVLSGVSNCTAGANANATREPGEPDHAGNTSGVSVWYQWTAPADRDMVFSTGGSEFDTVLAVYRGEAVSALVEIVSNDDLGSGLTNSRVWFSAAAGTNYYIAVEGSGGVTGAFTLCWYEGFDSLNEGADHPHIDFDSAALLGDPWFLQTSESHDGVDAMQSGEIFNNDRTELTATVPDVGRVSFWWLVDSEPEFDYLHFIVDGVTNDSITGTNGFWSNVVIEISSPTSTLTWAYEKDFLDPPKTWRDAGWVDQVRFVPSLRIDSNAGDVLTLAWTNLGYGLGLETTTNLVMGSWIPLPGTVTDDGADYRFEHAAGTNSRVRGYRLTQ